MKIALIGYGAWGSHHASTITETPGLELVAVCSPSLESRDAAARKLKVPTFADYRDLLAQSGLDAADIVVPTHLHREIGTAALAAGKHVLLEKPMAATTADCEAIIDAARQGGKILFVGHEMRISTQWGRMRRLIEEGAIGTPQYAAIDLWRRPYRPGAGNWRYDRRRVGSWTLEEPVHLFDAGCWWLREAGRPVSVYACGSCLPTSPEGLWDNLTAIVRFDSGAHLALTHSLAVCEHHQAAKVVGDRGSLLAFWDGEMDRTLHPTATLKLARNGHLEDIPIPPSGELFELRAELAHFVQVCQNAVPPIITPEEAALAVAICCAAERSIETGHPETI